MFSPNLLEGQRILVTGGGSGLGFAMASAFASYGASLCLLGRRQQKLEEAAARLPGTVQIVTCDIRDPQAVEGALEQIWQDSPLDVLVNNAAGNFAAPSESLSHRAVDAVLGTVLHGTAYITLGCGRRWLAEGRQGNVLSIVTTYASTGSGWVLPSAMGKAGIVAMTRSLAVEWGGRGIRLNAIAPGPFPTEGATERLAPDPRLLEVMRRQNPLQRFGDPAELANLAVFMVAPQNSYMNGEVVTLDGGEWLQGAGQFNFLRALSAEDWQKAASARKV
jgi:NAD(P)-dependent dehydrogenase (short-subunit alcohol dehydrogenase family)